MTLSKKPIKRSEKQQDIPSLELELRPYQTYAISEIVGNPSENKRFLIADEMGLGKTAQAIKASELLRNRDGKPTLIIVPYQGGKIPEVWEKEISKWSPEYNLDDIINISGLSKQKLDDIENKLDNINNDSIVITSYDSFKTTNSEKSEKIWEKLKRTNFSGYVLDEFHNIKNPDAKSTIKINALLSTEYTTEDSLPMYSTDKNVILLSGTPIPNDLDDIFMATKLLKPELMDNSSSSSKGLFKHLQNSETGRAIIKSIFQDQILSRTSNELNPIARNIINTDNKIVEDSSNMYTNKIYKPSNYSEEVILSELEQKIESAIVNYRTDDPTKTLDQLRGVLVNPNIINPLDIYSEENEAIVKELLGLTNSESNVCTYFSSTKELPDKLKDDDQINQIFELLTGSEISIEEIIRKSGMDEDDVIKKLNILNYARVEGKTGLNNKILETRTEGINGAKYQKLEDILKNENEKKTLIVSSYRTAGVIDDYISRLNDSGIKTIGFDGQNNNNNENIEKFKSGNYDVLVTQIKSINEGIDLSNADSIIFLDLPYTPAEFQQTIKRVYRNGDSDNRNDIKIRHLSAVSESESESFHTIDKFISDLIEYKSEAIHGITQGLESYLTEQTLAVLTNGTNLNSLIMNQVRLTESQKRAKMYGTYSKYGEAGLESMMTEFESQSKEVYNEYCNPELLPHTNNGNMNKLLDYLIRNDFDIDSPEVLEIGCGASPLSFWKDKNTSDYTLTGIDISTEAIVIAKDLWPDNSFHATSILNLPDDENLHNNYDIVVAPNVIHWLSKNTDGHTPSERAIGLGNINRQLKAGGKLIITFPYGYLSDAKIDQTEIYDTRFEFENGVESLGFRLDKDFSGTFSSDGNHRGEISVFEKIGEPIFDPEYESLEIKKELEYKMPTAKTIKSRRKNPGLPYSNKKVSTEFKIKRGSSTRVIKV